MVATLLLGSTLVFGCGGTPMEKQLPVLRTRAYTVPLDTLGLPGIVPASAARAWEVLPEVLTELGLDVNFREPAGRRVGACYQKLRSRLGKALLSTYVDCGDTRGVPNADRYEIALTVLTYVEATGAGTSKLHTFVLGVALDATGASSNRVWCYPKGTLEERIRASVEARAAS